MPMIIKNNVRYCSTGGDAESIVYNNTESGMEATNMQDAIDELNSNIDNQNKKFEPVLLWENPNISSNFSAQTITIDNLQKYKMIIIMIIYKGSRNYMPYTCINGVGNNYMVTYPMASMCRRIIEITGENTIKFNSGQYLNNGSFVNGDDNCMPACIYGIN